MKMDKTCENIQDKLWDYPQHLTKQDYIAVTQHLQHCDECRAISQENNYLQSLLKVKSSTTPNSLRRSLLQNFHYELSDQPSYRSNIILRLMRYGIAAVVLFCVGIYLFYPHQQILSPSLSQHRQYISSKITCSSYISKVVRVEVAYNKAIEIEANEEQGVSKKRCWQTATITYTPTIHPQGRLIIIE